VKAKRDAPRRRACRRAKLTLVERIRKEATFDRVATVIGLVVPIVVAIIERRREDC